MGVSSVQSSPAAEAAGYDCLVAAGHGDEEAAGNGDEEATAVGIYDVLCSPFCISIAAAM